MGAKDGGGDRDAKFHEPVSEAGTDAGGNRFAEEPSGGVHPGRVVEDKGILERDDVAFHALDLGDVG